MSVCTFLAGIIIGISGGLGFGLPAGRYYEKLLSHGAAPVRYTPPPPMLILSPSAVVIVPNTTIPLPPVQSSAGFWSFTLVIFCLTLCGLFVAVTFGASISKYLANVNFTNIQLMLSNLQLKTRCTAILADRASLTIRLEQAKELNNVYWVYFNRCVPIGGTERLDVDKIYSNIILDEAYDRCPNTWANLWDTIAKDPVHPNDYRKLKARMFHIGMDGRWSKRTENAAYGVKYFPDRRLHQKLGNQVWCPVEPGSILHDLMWENRRSTTNRFLFDYQQSTALIQPKPLGAATVHAPSAPLPPAPVPDASKTPVPDNLAPQADDTSSPVAPGPACSSAPLNKKGRQKLARKLKREAERAKKSSLDSKGHDGGAQGGNTSREP
jgi:hypothetical protein